MRSVTITSSKSTGLSLKPARKQIPNQPSRKVEVASSRKYDKSRKIEVDSTRRSRYNSEKQEPMIKRKSTEHDQVNGRPPLKINKPSVRAYDEKNVQRRRVRVSNLSLDIIYDDIRSAFAELGRIITGELTNGTAVLVFEDPELARIAIEKYDGGDLNGRKLCVDYD